MPSALAVVAHHDDHIIWMGGAIQQTRALGWDWLLIAMNVPPAHDHYFRMCCEALDTPGQAMAFNDYMAGPPFKWNAQAAMRKAVLKTVGGRKFDWVFTHSRHPAGEYAPHANHSEVRETVLSLMKEGKLATEKQSLAHFACDHLYGREGRATVARRDPPFESSHFIQLTYPELAFKAHWCGQAPDVHTSLKSINYPCPNPEGFEGEAIALPAPFLAK